MIERFAGTLGGRPAQSASSDTPGGTRSDQGRLTTPPHQWRTLPLATPTDRAAEMRARADDAVDKTTRAYWLWLAEEWDKTADRDRRRWAPRSWSEE